MCACHLRFTHQHFAAPDDGTSHGGAPSDLPQAILEDDGLNVAAPAPVTPGSSLDAWSNARSSSSDEQAPQVHRILLIESDVEAADRVIEILESAAYRVEIATDASYGMVLVESFAPHLILLGTVSQRMSGADFMRLLRNAPGFVGRAHITPVLYLVDNRHLLQQRFHGMRATPLAEAIFKPVERRELLSKVARALAMRAEAASPE